MSQDTQAEPQAQEDRHFMALAIAEAHKGRFWSSPNPHVGCVLVRNGQELSRGFTQPPGGAHAEIDALSKVSDARGATAYVTLEPCAHWGKTGPCADALITAGVSRVVAAIEDPYTKVAGQGFARLRHAGIDVVSGVLANEAREQLAGFLLRVTRGWGKVRLKLASSIDGRTAMASGESQWITGVTARADVQCMRAESCVVMTGIGTVLADNCSLTVRKDQLPLSGDELNRATTRAPLRVVLDSQLRIPLHANVVAGDAPTVIFHSSMLDRLNSIYEGAEPQPQTRVQENDSLADSAHQLGLPQQVVCQAVDVIDNKLDLRAVLQVLGERGANTILVEAGATLANSLLEAGLVDELVIYQAPKLLGASAKPLIGSTYTQLCEVPELRLIEVSRVGEDLRIIAAPLHQESVCLQEL